MKRKLIIFRIVCILALNGAVEQIQAQDFWCPNCLYVSGAGALTWMRDMDTRVEDLSSGNSFSVISDYKTGYGVSAAVGAVFCRNWRFEIEGYFRNNERDKLNVNTPDGSTLQKPHDHYRSFSLMFNGFYDFCLCEGLAWYLGGGIGPSWVEFKAGPVGLNGDPAFAIASSDLNLEDVRFSYQVMTGLAYQVSCDIWATAGYRLWGTLKEKDGHNNGIKVSERRVPLVQSLEFGLRFMF